MPDADRVSNASLQAVGSVLQAARSGIEALEGSWNAAPVDAWIRFVGRLEGRVVLSGMGKSGLVAQKIAATLASTGCPSFFMHPAEALHGDLGMVKPSDAALLLSNSGETEELLRLLPSLKRLGVKTGAITSSSESRLGQAVDWCFTYSLPLGEGCPLNIAPMASTTLQLVWGDVLAACLMIQKGFTLEEFAKLHPAGNIGSKLLRIKDLMHTEYPSIGPKASLVEVLGSMSRGRLGMTCVLDNGNLVGVVSDGDIRRAVERAEVQKVNPLALTAAGIMTRAPVSVGPNTLAIEAAGLLESRKITFLVVVDQGALSGVLHIHDLLAAKVI